MALSLPKTSWRHRAVSGLLRGLMSVVGQEAVTAMLFPGWNTAPRLGAAEMLKAYSTMPWLRAYMQKVAQDVASLTWQVFVPTNSAGRAIRDKQLQRAHRRETRALLLKRYAKQQQLREIPSHPLLDLLAEGNPMFPGLVSIQLTQLHVDLIGEWAWIFDYNNDRMRMPVRATPIPPTWISALPSPGNGEVYRVVAPGSTWEIPADRMLFSYHPDPANPFRRGSGLGQVLGDELQTDEYAAKHTRDWFANRAIPPVLISGLGVGLPELQRLEEKWIGKFNRVGAGWLPHFLGKKVDVHQLSQTFEAMQLGDLRGRERDTIRQVIGIPPEVTGDVSNSNRATIDSSDFIYQRHCIVPRAEFFRATLQERVAPRYDERLVIDYISPVSEDREFLLNVRKSAPSNWTVDEWRELGGSEPLDGDRGKVFLMPFNLVPVRSPDEIPDLPMPGPPVEPSPAAPSPPAPAAPPAGSEGPGPEGLTPEEPGDTEPPEPPDARAARRARVKAGLKPSAINVIVSAAKTEDVTQPTLPIIRTILGKFGQDAADEGRVDIRFDLRDPRVEAHLREFAASRMSDTVNATTKGAIREALADGIAEGDDFAGLKRRIREVFEEATDARASLIAKTETTRSSNFAFTEGMRQAGLEQKEWLSTQDGNVRDTHIALDGQIVGIDEMFKSESGASAPFPGEFGVPEEDCNCRCGVITVLAARGAVVRALRWKALERERLPYVRMLRRAFIAGFAKQERAVLAALEAESAAGEQAA